MCYILIVRNFIFRYWGIALITTDSQNDDSLMTTSEENYVFSFSDLLQMSAYSVSHQLYMLEVKLLLLRVNVETNSQNAKHLSVAPSMRVKEEDDCII